MSNNLLNPSTTKKSMKIEKVLTTWRTLYKCGFSDM